MTLSLRTLLFLVAVFAALLGIHALEHQFATPVGDSFEQFALLSLLVAVSGTFASVADDVWHDPESTFVAALCGFLGFSAIVVLGILVPAVWMYVW